MKNKSFTTDEVRLFYLWLAGRTPANKGDDKRLIFICCPAERENLLHDFTLAFHAEHRFFLLRRAILNK